MNETLQQRAYAALRDSIPLDTANIHVSADDSIITLSGSVENSDEKEIAVAVIQSVPGVKAIVQKLKIEISPEKAVANTIANEVKAALKENIEIPHNRIKVRIQPKCLVLEGVVRWNYQKLAALQIASRFISKIDIEDKIMVDNELKEELTKENIMEILKNDGRVVCDDLNVIVNGRNVILVGSVPFDEQKDLLQKITEGIPGIGAINNAVHIR